MNPKDVKFQCVKVPGDAYRWRLLARNGREFARSTGLAATLPACFAEISRIRDRIADAVIDVVSHPDGTIGWSLSIDDVTLAASTGSYYRRTDLNKSIELFRAGVVHAMVDPVVVMAAGRMRLDSRPRTRRTERQPASDPAAPKTAAAERRGPHDGLDADRDLADQPTDGQPSQG